MLSQNERNNLIEENIGLVGRVIKDRVHDVNNIGFYAYDDLFQTGCVGLCKAADSYKPGKTRFSTYAYMAIRNEIFNALEYATLRRDREEVTSPEALPDRCGPDSFAGTEYDLERILGDAQAQARGVVAKGIEAIRLLADGYTNREIGERMGGVNANNVTAWVSKARRYLKARPEIAALGEFI